MWDINADYTMDCVMCKEWKDVRLFHWNENYQHIELRAEFKHSLKIKMKNIYFAEISLQQLKIVLSSLYYSQKFNWLDAIIWLKSIPLIFTCIGPVLHCYSRAQWFNIDLCLQRNHTLCEPYILFSFVWQMRKVPGLMEQAWSVAWSFFMPLKFIDPVHYFKRQLKTCLCFYIFSSFHFHMFWYVEA